MFSQRIGLNMWSQVNSSDESVVKRHVVQFLPFLMIGAVKNDLWSGEAIFRLEKCYFTIFRKKQCGLNSLIQYLTRSIVIIDGYDLTKMIENIRQLYEIREGTINLLPWCGHSNFSFGDFYTRLKVVYKERARGTATVRVVTISEIFNPQEECEEPRVVLIEGEPGMERQLTATKLFSTGPLKNAQPEITSQNSS